MVATSTSETIERRGRRWIVGAFALCPCHLPLTLTALTSLFGSTFLGATIESRTTTIVIITAGWIIGTANGFRLVRHAQRGTCPMPLRRHIRTDW